MGKIVVKKIQSQASNTAFTIPSADGTTGQVLKTDGSANLGWTDKSSKIGSAGIDYTMPASDGTAGQLLQTNGTGGVLEFVSPATNPLSTPDGNHQGIRLCDKYFCGLNDAANVSSVTLTVPSSYTTEPSDVLTLELYLSGMTQSQTVSYDDHFKITMLGQDGSTTSRATGSLITMYSGYGNQYKDWNVERNWGTDPTTGNDVYFNVGHNYNSYSDRTRWSTTQDTFSKHPVGQLMATWFNSATYPVWMAQGSMGRTNFASNELPGQRIYQKAANYSSTNGFHKTTPSNLKHSLGMKIEWKSGYTMRDGVFMLFARFKDGVVS
tara:strand:- start:3205 stop:4173 length:969 start_codon:yes stop_codon:yes gene_type:complete